MVPGWQIEYRGFRPWAAACALVAPFANFPGGGTVDLPPPAELDAGIKLTGFGTGSWTADRSGGSGRITVGLNLRAGSFDARLLGQNGSEVGAVGSWECAP